MALALLGSLAFLVMAMQQEAKAVTPAGTYVNWYWPGTPGGYKERSWNFTALNDSSPSANFYAHQQGFVNGNGFYFGLQTANSGKPKWALFSVWGTTQSSTRGGIGTCQPFSGEGEGQQCFAEYNWQAGRTYTLKVYEESRHWWRAQITDTVTGQTTRFGKIRTPRSWGGLDTWSVEWTEHFIDREARCEDLPYSKVHWAVPVSNDSVRPSSSEPYITPNSCAFNSRITKQPDGSYIDEEGIAKAP